MIDSPSEIDQTQLDEDVVERAFNPSGTVFLLFFWAFFYFGWFFILHVVDTVTDVALKITVGTVPLLA